MNGPSPLNIEVCHTMSKRPTIECARAPRDSPAAETRQVRLAQLHVAVDDAVAELAPQALRQIQRRERRREVPWTAECRRRRRRRAMAWDAVTIPGQALRRRRRGLVEIADGRRRRLRARLEALEARRGEGRGQQVRIRGGVGQPYLKPALVRHPY